MRLIRWSGKLSSVDRLSTELLGFEPDARVLIINCDDLGMHDAINTAVVEAMENGIASSCSLMVPCPAAAAAMEMLRERPHLSFGLHLTLICDSADYRWGPTAVRSDVASLLDPKTGEFYVNTSEGRAALLSGASLTDVERELRAQIDAVLDAGLAPTHIDWHCLADGGRPDIFALSMELAAEYGLAARVWLDDGRRTARKRGLPVIDNAFVDSYAIDLDAKAAAYGRMLRELSVGLSEWAIHPAHVSEQWKAIEPTGWRVRDTDRLFLTSSDALQILREESITIMDYSALQMAWNG